MSANGSRSLAFSVQAPPAGQLSHFTVQKEGFSLSQNPLAAPIRLPRLGAPPRQRLVSGAPLLLQAGSYVSGMIAHYQSLPGNLPAKYKNNIALWTTTVPNLAMSPLVEANITTDTQVGDVLLSWPIQATDYCITYQTGASITTMCALAQVPLGAPLPDPVFNTLSILSLTTDTLTVYYCTIPGAPQPPDKAGYWVGLYVGRSIPYAGGSYQLSSRPTAASPEGPLSLPFTPGYQNYTVVFFTGPDITNAAAAVTFNVNNE